MQFCGSGYPQKFSVIEFLKIIIARIWSVPFKNEGFLNVAAITVHYLIGVVFALYYAMNLINYPLAPNDFLSHFMMTGTFYGIIALIAWSLSFIFILNQLPASLVLYFLACIFLAHFLFSFIMIHLFHYFPHLV